MKRVVLLGILCLLGCNSAEIDSLKQEKASLVAENEDLQERLDEAKAAIAEYREKMDQKFANLISKQQNLVSKNQKLEEKIEATIEKVRKTPENQFNFDTPINRFAVLTPEEATWIRRATRRYSRSGASGLTLPESLLITWLACGQKDDLWETTLQSRHFKLLNEQKIEESLLKFEKETLDALIEKLKGNPLITESDWKLIRGKFRPLVADWVVDAFQRNEDWTRRTMEFLNLSPALKREFVLQSRDDRIKWLSIARNLMEEPPEKYLESEVWMTEYGSHRFLRGKIAELEKELAPENR